MKVHGLVDGCHSCNPAMFSSIQAQNLSFRTLHSDLWIMC
jgi:hypothetical protein